MSSLPGRTLFGCCFCSFCFVRRWAGKVGTPLFLLKHQKHYVSPGRFLASLDRRWPGPQAHIPVWGQGQEWHRPPGDWIGHILPAARSPRPEPVPALTGI